MGDPVLFISNNYKSSKILQSSIIHNPNGKTKDGFVDPIVRLKVSTRREHPDSDQMVLNVEDARRLSRKLSQFLKAVNAPVERRLIDTEEDVKLLKDRISEICGVNKEYMSVKTKSPDIVLARDLFFAFLRRDRYAKDEDIGILLRYGRTSVILASQKIADRIKEGDKRVCPKAVELLAMYAKPIDYLS